MHSTAPSFGWLVSGAALSLILFAHSAAAQSREFVGPGKCIDCHDHASQKAWATKDPHLKALDQLDGPKAAGWAKAAGVGDPYDAKGLCVRCHGTVVRGSADFGVTCESCHGAGKDFLKPHQTKGSYREAVGLGMKDNIKRPEAWVRECQACHLLGGNAGDAALIKAGHPSGADFDLSVKFANVALHFSTKYAPAQIAGLARAGARPTTASAPAAPPAAVPAPAAVAPPAPAAVPAPATPAPVTPAPAPAAAPVAPPRATATAPAPAAAPPAVPPPPAPPPAAAPAPSAGAPAAPPVEPAAPPPQTPQTPARIASAIQGRVVGLLEALLSRGTAVRMVPPAATMSYRGEDAELLQLQREAIALALEALAAAPPAAKPPK
jgi:hypothetical protein